MHPRYRTVQRSYEQPIVLVAVPLVAAALVLAFVFTSDLSQTWLGLAIVEAITVDHGDPAHDRGDQRGRARAPRGHRPRHQPDRHRVGRGARYSALKQFGGWGWRIGRDGSRAFTIAGNRAAVVTLADGREIYIGSKDPERVVGEILLRLGPQPH